MEPFLGEIRLMGFGITPKGWQPCQGQLLPINQNQALFALLGTMYGGNGKTTFALPDLRGRAIVGVGQGPGLSGYIQGQAGGSEGVTLTVTQMPGHAHLLAGSLKADGGADASDPAGAYPAAPTDGTLPFATGAPNTTMSTTALTGNTANAGSGAPHENRQPVLSMNYCIAVQGIFPSRD
jgi:microcystin-dependent protein